MLSPYIAALRQKVGHDFLLLPSVTVLVFDAEDRVLLVKHHNNEVWVAPGGAIEPDETPEAAAQREMKEETGYEVEIDAILGTYGGPQFRITYSNGDQVGYVMSLYKARIIGGNPTPDGQEILDVRFFSYEETKEIPCGQWLSVVLDDVYKKGWYKNKKQAE
jgi:8-oxo-dGTP pyrophosphatase MutT (NUDIX family)